MGISESVAMKLVGMKTNSIFRRYFIVDEAVLREAGDKMTWPDSPSTAKVRPMKAQASR
jgi:hypothetical protein